MAKGSAETDDEPPCEEEIYYNTDSCSEEEISELDNLNAEDSQNEEKNSAEKELGSEELSKEDVLPTKLNCSTGTSLPVAPKQYGCSPEVACPLSEQNCEHSSKTQMAHYLY